MKALALASLLLASSAWAQAVPSANSPAKKPAFLPGDRVAAQDTYICLIPDTQNQMSSDDQDVDSESCRVTASPFYGCVPPYCAHSPYCKDSWWQTGRQLGFAQAYDMTGQWDKVDFEGITGTDNARSPWWGAGAPVQSHWNGAKDHPRCDLIISLGDITDMDFLGDPPVTTLDAIWPHGARQWEIAKDYYSIIDRSGTPYILTQGNHDPNQPYKRLQTQLNTTGKSFYYATEPTYGLSYAIRAKTPLGVICVISLSWWAVGGGNSAYPSLSDNPEHIWASDNIGCGDGSPTILVSHNGQDSGIRDDAANAALFMRAWGHYVQLPFSTKNFRSVGDNGWAMDGFDFFSDWQEEDRHGSTAFDIATGFGNTPSDGGGIWYTIIRISPRLSKVQAWDWSPYWLTRKYLKYGADTNSTLDSSFPWCTRFAGHGVCP